jgi:putative ABC transport system permease protein
MYNSIIERTREIGILKSLGATKSFIVKEIMKEALLITAIGIVIGYSLTYCSLILIKNIFPLLEMEMTPDWMIYSAMIAAIAALLGTVYPAARASRLDPVVAISHE